MTADHLWLDQVTPPPCICGHTWHAHESDHYDPEVHGVVRVTTARRGGRELSFAVGACRVQICGCSGWAP